MSLGVQRKKDEYSDMTYMLYILKGNECTVNAQTPKQKE